MIQRTIIKGDANSDIVNSIVKTLPNNIEGETLLIVDRYFLSEITNGSGSHPYYAYDTFKDIINKFTNVSKILVVSKTKNANATSVLTQLRSRLGTRQIDDFIRSDDFHDRYWIMLKEEQGVCVGMSMNGMESSKSKTFTVSRLSKCNLYKVLRQLSVLENKSIVSKTGFVITYSNLVLKKFGNVAMPGTSYWIHKLAYRNATAKALLKKGYLSIGFGDFGHKRDVNALRTDAQRAFEEEWGVPYKKKNRLLNFIFEMSKNDRVIVPSYPENGQYSVYRISIENVIPAESLDLAGLLDENGNQLRWDGRYITANGEPIDFGFFWKVQSIAEGLPITDTVGEKIKSVDVNERITDIKIKNSILYSISKYKHR